MKAISFTMFNNNNMSFTMFKLVCSFYFKSHAGGLDLFHDSIILSDEKNGKKLHTWVLIPYSIRITNFEAFL